VKPNAPVAAAVFQTCALQVAHGEIKPNLMSVISFETECDQ
jgi:hypothetical protein